MLNFHISWEYKCNILLGIHLLIFMLLIPRLHNEHAGRFSDLVATLDLCKLALGAANVDYMLQAVINARAPVNMLNRTGGNCLVAGIANDGRYQIPLAILNWIFANQVAMQLPFRVARNNNSWTGGSKVTLTWIACYIARNLPNALVGGWTFFQCSHRCLTCGFGSTRPDLMCVDDTHLHWENPPTNQSRGHTSTVCCRACHCGCGQTICLSNLIHVPNCI